MTELKPCPFCGGKAIIDKSSRGNHQVWCPKCYAVQMGMFYDTPETAIAAWNRRVDQQAEIERLKAVPEKWVPVNDGLPEQVCDDSSADCLIAIRYNYDLPNERPSLCTGYLLDGKWWAYMDHDCHLISDGDVVTHWMQLPEPPKEGET